MSVAWKDRQEVVEVLRLCSMGPGYLASSRAPEGSLHLPSQGHWQRDGIDHSPKACYTAEFKTIVLSFTQSFA